MNVNNLSFDRKRKRNDESGNFEQFKSWRQNVNQKIYVWHTFLKTIKKRNLAKTKLDNLEFLKANAIAGKKLIKRLL